MSAEEKIEHTGVVVSARGEKLVVEIQNSSACSTCKAAQLCTSSESKKKLIDVYAFDGKEYHIGDVVTIEGERSMGMRAVVLAYVIPLVLMVAVIVVMQKCGATEIVSALSGIGVEIPYFIWLYAIRRRLNKAFTFKTKNQIIQ